MIDFFVKYPRLGRLFDMLLPLLATLAALGVGAIMLNCWGLTRHRVWGAAPGRIRQPETRWPIRSCAPPPVAAWASHRLSRRGDQYTWRRRSIGRRGDPGHARGLFPDAPGIVIVPLAALLWWIYRRSHLGQHPRPVKDLTT